VAKNNLSKSQTEGTHNLKLLPPIKVTFGDSALTCSINIISTFVAICQLENVFVSLGELKRGGASLITNSPSLSKGGG
jgi:hypothetical protein